MADLTCLVVDDDPTTLTLVTRTLQRAGIETVEATTGEDCLEVFDADAFDIVVLDNILPNMRGEDICRYIRQRSEVPILFMSKFADEIDRIVGLELGADDYISKPFNPRELLARVRAVLRRTGRSGTVEEPVSAERAGDEGLIELGPLVLDLNQYQVAWAGEDVDLTKTEFEILQVLAGAPGRVFPRAELIEQVYEDTVVSERTIDSHVRRVRKKFRRFDVELIQTVRGVGFQINSFDDRSGS
jgi:two-component system OmpR family response regulator